MDRPTYLILKPRRYICRTCTESPVTTQRMDWVEGINHKIRVLMERCYGLFNPIRLFQQLSLEL
jgi:transposase